ncbi:MAG: hypothetical protein KAW12_03240 [Candidatus Aminicenantes bacterium]|nr:hypothetical protein [Candidatus Aminicenantes bacterium]
MQKGYKISDKLIWFVKDSGGYVRMKDLKAANFKTQTIKKSVADNELEKIKAGLYRLADIEDVPDMSIGFIDTVKAIPDGVIALISALHYYDMTTFNPSHVYVAVPHNKRAPKLIYPPLRVFYFRKRFYEPGIERIETPYGDVKIYGREKTICDMFRYRKKLGEDIALEALKSYVDYKHSDFFKLMQYAEICQVKTVIQPYLKALVG